MSDFIKIEKSDHIMTIGLNRPDKKNALTRAMFRELTEAYTELCDDPDVRCGILYSTSDIFTAGLDMMDVAPALMNPADDGMKPTAEDEVDPFGWAGLDGKVGRLRNTPMIAAVNGRCFTAGIELALGTDIIIADADTTFTQAEIRRGLMPLGGAIAQYTERFGWGNAMRWLLTGDIFDAAEAHRIGMVQEITPSGKALERAREIAGRIVSAAPLGIAGTLENAQIAVQIGAIAAADHIRPYMQNTISTSKDLQEGIGAMMQKRKPVFMGE